MQWGIIGSGFIANQFARDSAALPDVTIQAVYSRSHEKAAAFAKAYGIPKAYGALDALLSDTDIENIYIAAPNALHRPLALAAIAAGKNVLCEKPLAVNAREAREITAAARNKNVFFMEAMWTRFFPAVCKALSLAGREAGEFCFASVDLGYDGVLAGERGTWHFDRRFGAGALMDMGIYALWLSYFLFGRKPNSVLGQSHIENGIDETTTAILTCGKHYAFTCSLVSDTACSAAIYCTRGTIILPRYWWHPSSCIFIPGEGDPVTYAYPFEREGLQYEIAAFEDAARQGLTEHPYLSHEASHSVMETMDSLRRMLGICYPADDIG
jgi:predicted dehydrogenase